MGVRECSSGRIVSYRTLAIAAVFAYAGAGTARHDAREGVGGQRFMLRAKPQHFAKRSSRLRSAALPLARSEGIRRKQNLTG